jgi:hypothetical protein
MNRPLAVAVLALHACAYPEAFQKASVEFAEATSTGVQHFEPQFAAASTLCRTRARLDFLQKRLQPGASWGSTPYWSEWFAEQRINPSSSKSETWKQHCDRIASVESVYHRALTLLDAYANSLSALGASGSYDGADLRDMANQASGVSKSLGSAPIIGKTLAGLGEPLTKLADFLLITRTVQEMRTSVRAANPLVQSVLEALSAYGKSTEAELRDAEARLNDLLVTLEIRTGVVAQQREGRKNAAVDPADALVFYRFAVETEDAFAGFRSGQESYAGAVADLARSHALLAAAAELRGPKAVVTLKRALGYASQALRAGRGALLHQAEPAAPAADTTKADTTKETQ